MARRINKVTSKRVAKIASKLLRSPKTSKSVKAVAASNLSQRQSRSRKK